MIAGENTISKQCKITTTSLFVYLQNITILTTDRIANLDQLMLYSECLKSYRLSYVPKPSKTFFIFELKFANTTYKKFNS